MLVFLPVASQLNALFYCFCFLGIMNFSFDMRVSAYLGLFGPASYSNWMQHGGLSEPIEPPWKLPLVLMNISVKRGHVIHYTNRTVVEQ